jgi:hypothetical protein
VFQRTGWNHNAGSELAYRLEVVEHLMMVVRLGLQLRILCLKLRSPSFRLHQLLMQYKLMLLYLLNKERCLAVMRELVEADKQFLDRLEDFKRSHNGKNVMMPNDSSSGTAAERDVEMKV